MGNHDDQKENRLQFLGENDRAHFLKSEVMLICCFQKKKREKKEEKKKLETYSRDLTVKRKKELSVKQGKINHPACT